MGSVANTVATDVMRIGRRRIRPASPAGSAWPSAPVMAMATDLTVVQARHIVPLEAMDPETIVTPSIFVDRVVHVSNDREWDI